ncbi:MAG: hypothetical protein ACI4DP_09715, partial [Candidatus Ornithomonoglobus sp.]
MKKFISLFTTLALLISICTAMPISVSAQDSVAEDLSQYLDNKWIHISAAQDLKDFADDVNIGNTYACKTVVLDNDIDLSQICGEDINGETVSWTPIGAETIFDGTFNGNGHTISGLYINSKYVNLAGVFGFCGENSQIVNLTVEGSVTVGYNDGGGAQPPFGLGGIA